MRLNQVIAIANGEKSRKQSVFTTIYQTLSKKDLLEGISKRYQPFEEDPSGKNSLPPEDKLIQTTVESSIAEAKAVLGIMFNIVATQDEGNCNAKADIVVKQTQPGVGIQVVSQVPVTTLLFLEKQLVDIRTFVSALPILDPAEEWTLDEVSGYWKTAVKTTFRTRKTLRNHVKAEATDKHPAQVDVYAEDEPIGKWATTRFSGAIRKVDRDEMLDKIDELDKAVKIAREQANSIEVTKSTTGDAILEYIFG